MQKYIEMRDDKHGKSALLESEKIIKAYDKRWVYDLLLIAFVFLVVWLFDYFNLRKAKKLPS